MTQILYLNDYRNQPSLSRFVRKKNANANAIKSHDDLPLVGPVFGRALCIERKKKPNRMELGIDRGTLNDGFFMGADLSGIRASVACTEILVLGLSLAFGLLFIDAYLNRE